MEGKMVGSALTRRSVAWLATSIAAATTAISSGSAEPMRLSAAEADQITAGSFDDSWLDDAWWDDLLEALKGEVVETVRKGDTMVVELSDSQSVAVVMGGRAIDLVEVRDRTFEFNSITIVIR
jgi:hypothetical protein